MFPGIQKGPWMEDVSFPMKPGLGGGSVLLRNSGVKMLRVSHLLFGVSCLKFGVQLQTPNAQLQTTNLGNHTFGEAVGDRNSFNGRYDEFLPSSAPPWWGPCSCSIYPGRIIYLQVLPPFLWTDHTKRSHEQVHARGFQRVDLQTHPPPWRLWPSKAWA